LTSADTVLRTEEKNTWLHRWIYLLAVNFMFVAALLRAVLVYQNSPLLGIVLILLAAFLVACIGSILLAGKLPWASAGLIGVEMLLILAMLLLTRSDFFAFMFAITGMQVMQHYTPKTAAAVIALSALLSLSILIQPSGVVQALALTLAFAALSTFLAAYIASTRRARLIQERQQILVGELREANRKLEIYSQQVQQLAAGRERQRLARELHDSITQTIFSMTLATQSALLLLDHDRPQVSAQLDRLDQLAQGTLAEMQVLISELTPEVHPGGSFLAALEQHLSERQQLNGLDVSLEVTGSEQLDPAEEASLLRVAQEALNNIVKHAHISQAVLRLHLAEPFWMEIEDSGAGFDPQQPMGSERLGLAGMRERVSEIGWTQEIDSAPGRGTRIRVQKGVKTV
jgi:signal transduction histidine kinase